MKKILCLLLSVLMVISFASCKPSEGNPEDTTVSGTGNKPAGEVTTSGGGTVQPGITEITATMLSNFRIIYPHSAQGTPLEAAARNLAEKIADAFGVTVTTATDFYAEGSKTYYIGEYEILVGGVDSANGFVNRSEVKTYLSSILSKDYGYALVGKKLVIAGHDDQDTSLKAVEEFIKNCVTGASDTSVFFAASQAKTVGGEYLHKGVTIGGVSLAEYRIVYPSANSKFEASLAQKLADAVAADCGIILTVISDRDDEYEDGYEILIGETGRDADTAPVQAATAGKGYVGTEGKFIVIGGDSAYGNVNAMQAFVDMFAKQPASETVLDITITNGEHEAPAGNMSNLSLDIGDGKPRTSDVESIISTILTYLPDTVTLQNVSFATDGLFSSLEAALGGYYAFIGESHTDDANERGNVILYVKDKFEAIESGTRWYTDSNDDTKPGLVIGAQSQCSYAFAHLERISDKTTVLVISTRFDTIASARTGMISRLKDFIYQYKDSAVVVGANTNCDWNADEFALLVDEFVVDVSDMFTIPAGDVDPKTTTDHILLHDEYMDVVAMAYVKNSMISSDAHYFLFVEYSIDMDGTDVADKRPNTSGNMNLGSDREGEDFNPPIFIF